MSPATTTTLGRQARSALEQVRKEISSHEQRLQELRAEEQKIRSVLETLQPESARPAARQATQRTRQAASRSTRSSAQTRKQTASKSGAGAGVSAEERQKRILELLAKKELTREELAEALGVSKVRVGQLMDSLLKEKKVEVRNDPRAKRPKKLFRAAGTKPTVKAKA